MILDAVLFLAGFLLTLWGILGLEAEESRPVPPEYPTPRPPYQPFEDDA